MKDTHYNKAPIQEALLDFVVIPTTHFSTTLFKRFQEALGESYEKKDKISVISARLELGQGQPSVAQSSKMHGFKFASLDGKYIIQARDDRFTFSILNSYEDWNSFRTEAFRIWTLYKNTFKPRKVTRQGLRFINRIAISEKIFKLEKYFNIFPSVFLDEAEGVDELNMSHFFMQTLLQPKQGGTAVVNMVPATPFESEINDNLSIIILDIDVFDALEFDSNDEALLQRVELLRTQKNKIFELSITDEVRREIA